MRPHVYLYVCGILTFPGDARNWTGRAVTWTHLNTPAKAEKIEYFTGPIGRAFCQQHRARKLARTLEFYASHGWDITLVGHSNGCDVILDTLQDMVDSPPTIRALHLISAACEEDFDRNGLNWFEPSVVRDVAVWIASDDMPLWLADSLAGRLVGFGALGRRGPVNAAGPVKMFRQEGGHSHWFAPCEFDRTMRRITRS